MWAEANGVETKMLPCNTAKGLENHDWYATITFANDVDAPITFTDHNGIKLNATSFPYGTATSNASGKQAIPANSYKLFFNDITGQYLFLPADGTSLDSKVKPTDEYGTLDVESVGGIDLDNVAYSASIKICDVLPVAAGAVATNYHALLGSDFSVDVEMTDDGKINASRLKELSLSAQYAQAKRRAPSVVTGYQYTHDCAIPAKIYATYRDGEMEYLRLSDEFTINTSISKTIDLDSAYYYIGDGTAWDVSTDYKLQPVDDNSHVFRLVVEKGSPLIGYFKLFSQSAYNDYKSGRASLIWDGQTFGAADDGLKGAIAPNEDAPYSFNVSAVPDGYDGYLLTFDFDKMTYDFELIKSTGIENVNAKKAKHFNVYTVSGQLVKKNASSLKGLPAGTYIANGKVMVVR